MPQHRTRPGVEYRGRWFALDRQGYYRHTSRGQTRLLHREVYAHEVGPVPPGHEIHHRDTDKSNNDPSNLVALTPAAHRKAHGARGGASSWDPETRGRERRAAWERRQPRPITCAWCGVEFLSTGMRARFCSRRHYDAARYAALHPRSDDP